MNDRDIRRADRALRVKNFGLLHQQTIAALPKAAQLFGELDPLVAKLRDPVGKQALHDALFLDFKDIARTARSIALDEPGFAAAPFRFPADYSEKTRRQPPDPTRLIPIIGRGDIRVPSSLWSSGIRPLCR
jgi:hypothetical protein